MYIITFFLRKVKTVKCVILFNCNGNYSGTIELLQKQKFNDKILKMAAHFLWHIRSTGALEKFNGCFKIVPYGAKDAIKELFRSVCRCKHTSGVPVIRIVLLDWWCYGVFLALYVYCTLKKKDNQRKSVNSSVLIRKQHLKVWNTIFVYTDFCPD